MSLIKDNSQLTCVSNDLIGLRLPCCKINIALKVIYQN